jgi:hypothetical protein
MHVLLETTVLVSIAHGVVSTKRLIWSIVHS